MRIKLAITLAAAISAALTLTAHAQTTYYVNGACGDDAWAGTSAVCIAPDGPKKTIQAGIDASVTTDTVIVADGTYTGAGNRDLDFAGRDIHLRSESLDPNLCIIDCQGSAADPHRGFHFHSGETNNAVVEGFTITNGFVSSRGFNAGGGMLNENSSPTVTNCTFSANTAGGGGGGGMHNRNGSSPVVSDCTFRGNLAAGPPGAGDGGGMVNVSDSSPIVTNCTFSGNSANHLGGGMYNRFSNTTITNCTFSGNSATLAGGGMANDFSSPTVTNCTFNNNTAGEGGGMDNFSDSSPIVTNCTFSGNSAPVGGGICTTDRFGGHSETTVNNTIAWGNTPDQIRDSSGATTTVTYSDVQGGWLGAGSNNKDEDPLFVDPGTGNYHILPLSPVIDAADNTAVPPGVTTDLDGNPRFMNDPLSPNTGVPGNGHAEIVDMGAYEFPGEVCYADCDGNGSLDIFDFLCFQNSFVAGEPYACDCDPDPACNIFDFLCFQNAFVGGCP